MAKITVPLDLVEIDHGSYHIFVACTINGIEAEILIDTGASRTVLNMEFFTEASQEIEIDEILSSGVGPGQLDTKIGVLHKFSIGKKQWKNLTAMFMDLSHINELYGRISHKRIAGLIGGDFLFKTNAHINYEKKVFKFTTSSKTKQLFI
jgi:hypothetical protein